MACSGKIGSTSRNESSSYSDSKSEGGADSSRADLGGDEVGVDPGSKGIHRLNDAEYNATVADVLGTKLQPANSSWLGGELGGFDNMAAVLDIDEEQYARYFEAAGNIADDVFASPTLRAKVVVCTTDDVACAKSIIANTAKRLFRRPLAPQEVATFQKVYEEARRLGQNHEAAAKQVLRALLCSAEFLYRIEFDGNAKPGSKHLVDPYELASRLSYCLWSSAPDDALFAAAGDDSLGDDEKIVAAVDRMLADAKATRFIENFSGQWLGTRKLPDHAASTAVYPGWSSQLADSMAKEMYQYFGEFLKSDRSWLDFMKADLNFVDGPLAKHYGFKDNVVGMLNPRRHQREWRR